MGTLFKLTGTATLLIGLQLFTTEITYAAKVTIPGNISRHSFLDSADASRSRQTLISDQLRINDYEPPDNGGPDNSRGSGTR